MWSDILNILVKKLTIYNLSLMLLYTHFQSQVHRQKRLPMQAHLIDHKHEVAENPLLSPSNEDCLKDLPSLPSKCLEIIN